MKQTKTLPSEIPIFPLSNFIFFPKTSIPLNIFEPRYLQMIRDSLKKDRFIGMVQPKKNIKKLSKNNPPEIYSIGCVGKITDFNETGDGRIILILNGISRFKILVELDNNKLYRECKVSFDQFKEDIKEMEKTSKFLDIDLLFKDLKNFFRKKNFPKNPCFFRFFSPFGRFTAENTQKTVQNDVFSIFLGENV